MKAICWLLLWLKVSSITQSFCKLAATETKFKRGVPLGVWLPSLRAAVPSPPPPPGETRKGSLASVSPWGERVRLHIANGYQGVWDHSTGRNHENQSGG